MDINRNLAPKPKTDREEKERKNQADHFRLAKATIISLYVACSLLVGKKNYLFPTFRLRPDIELDPIPNNAFPISSR